MAKRPDNKNPEMMVSYYPRHVETGLLMMKLRDYGLFRDEHQDFKVIHYSRDGPFGQKTARTFYLDFLWVKLMFYCDLLLALSLKLSERQFPCVDLTAENAEPNIVIMIFEMCYKYNVEAVSLV